MPILPLTLDIYRSEPGRRELIKRARLDEPGSYLIGRHATSIVKIEAREVSREHCILEVTEDQVTVTDRSQAGTWVGETRITRQVWDGSAELRIPRYEFHWRRKGSERSDAATKTAAAPVETGTRLTPIDITNIFGVGSSGELEKSNRFPSTVFKNPAISPEEVYKSGFFAGDTEYLGLGGGIGSFVWVDHLRIYGVPASDIKVIGLDHAPYANYERYCRNSQIPVEERLRSNSASAPDNIWGFPGYASRESWHGLKNGRLGAVSKVIDVFGEPALRQSYTPTAGAVFRSIDKEAIRIGWASSLIQGKVLCLRRTTDGRYAVAYRLIGSSPGVRRDNIILARHVHIAMGYPATRFTDEIQQFIFNNGQDRQLIANAYEKHEALYEEIERSGRPEVIVVRGRGIVASRILQRLRVARDWNSQIQIIHQIRSPLKDGAGERWKLARRHAFNDVEHQPFNWPKACWGGELRKEIEGSGEVLRSKMFAALGGTTTAVRNDWQAIIREGVRGGWYRKSFGVISKISADGPTGDRKIVIDISNRGAHVETIRADYIIDCTGLIADPEQSPFLKDLIGTYQLRRNRVSGPGGQQRVTGITVTNNFEILGLRNGRGTVHSSGTLTQNGPYAPVDSFLGLQYAALRSVDQLASRRAQGLSSFGPLKSLGQWLKWCSNKTPEGARAS